MIKLLLIPFCVFTFGAIGQIDLHGTIISKQTGEPVPYVNIGVIGAYSGTVSNSDGNFQISFGEQFLDSIVRISMYGYEPIECPLGVFKKQLDSSDHKVIFSEKVFEQEEVVAVGVDMKEKVLGRVEKKGSILIQFLSDQMGAQIGTIIKIKKRTILKDFNFYLRQSGYDSVTFRLNFYDYDVKTDTGDSLVAESIVFNVVGEHDGVFTLDLSDKYIQLREDFIVAIEIVGGNKEGGMEKNPSIWFGGGFGGGCKAKIASQSAWVNVPVSAVGFYLNVRQAKRKE